MPDVTTILFVNKTAGSGNLSQSKGIEKSKIFSHVQRSAYNRVSKAGSAAKVLYQTPEDWSNPANEKPEPINSHRGRRRRLQRRAQHENSTASPPKTCTATHICVPPMDRFATPTGDPFSSLAVVTSPYMEHLLKFYSSDVVPRIFPIKSLAIVSREYTLAFAYQDPLLRDTLLCTTSATLCCHTGDQKHGVAAMSFKVKALNKLQTTLLRPTDRETAMSSLYAVSLLLWIECLNGSITDLRAHSIGLKQLVSHVGDISESPLCILTTVLTCSYLCSAMLNAPPNLTPVVIGGTVRLSSAAQTILRAVNDFECNENPHPLFTPSVVNLMGPDLAKVAFELRDVMLLRDWCTNNELSSTISDIEYIYTKKTSVEYQLVQLPYEVTLTPAQDAIRLVLFIFPQAFILISRPSAAFNRTMTARLRRSLERSGLSRMWAPHCGLLIWLLFIGAHISFQETEFTWFQSQLSNLFAFLGIQSMAEVESILDGFYYYPNYFGSTLNGIWEAHVNQ